MDVAAFRWVLLIIAIVLAVAVYFFSQHQARLRKRSALESWTREEVDSAFIEDEQLHFELNNLNRVLRENEAGDEFDDIEISPARDEPITPYALPDPALYVPPAIAAQDESRLISYHLRHEDYRLITGEETQEAAAQAGLTLGDSGYLEFIDGDDVEFRVASLSQPGVFNGFDRLEFSTLGFNCFIDIEHCDNPRLAYETMLKKIDELVRATNVKVYKPTQELLTISDVTRARQRLGQQG